MCLIVSLICAIFIPKASFDRIVSVLVKTLCIDYAVICMLRDQAHRARLRESNQNLAGILANIFPFSRFSLFQVLEKHMCVFAKPPGRVILVISLSDTLFMTRSKDK